MKVPRNPLEQLEKESQNRRNWLNEFGILDVSGFPVDRICSFVLPEVYLAEQVQSTIGSLYLECRVKIWETIFACFEGVNILHIRGEKWSKSAPKIPDIADRLIGRGREMRWVQVCLFLLSASSSWSALPPLAQSIRELQAILSHAKLYESLGSAEQIREIVRTDTGYLVVTQNYAMRVELRTADEDRRIVGPAWFELEFSEPIPLAPVK